MLDAKCANLNEIERGIEDRNRTAPFPFCGNRFEFRAVGSSQSCAFPMAMVDTAFADGMRALSELLEGGMVLRDACAQIFKENERVIFTGNGYSAEWPVEAEKRGLPNLRDAVSAAQAFNTAENKALFERMGVYTAAEVDARAECFLENYVSCLEIEASTLVEMVRTGLEAAMAADIAVYAAGDRSSVTYTTRKDAYTAVTTTTNKLAAALAAVPGDDLSKTAEYCRDTLKVLIGEVRIASDIAEGLVKKSLWPFPSYTECTFGHHFNAAK